MLIDTRFSRRWSRSSSSSLSPTTSCPFLRGPVLLREARAKGFKVFIDHDLSQSVAHVGTLAYTHPMAVACRDKTPVLLNGLNLNTSTSAPAVVKEERNVA